MKSEPVLAGVASVGQDFLHEAILLGPLMALQRLADRTSNDLEVFRSSLIDVELRLKEIAQVVASAQTVLQSQASSRRISFAPPIDRDRVVAEAVASKFLPTIRPDDSTPPRPNVAATPTMALTDEASIRELLETLPDVSQLGGHTGKRLFNALPNAGITKTPRSGSRGDALLYVLSRYGRNRSLSIADLEFAFKTMNVPLGNAPSYHRIVSWEIRELIRRGWPITEDSGGFRFDGTPAQAEGTMT